MHTRIWSALLAASVSTAALAQSSDGAAAPAKPGKPPQADAGPPKLSPEGKRWVEAFLGKWRSKDMKVTMGDKVVPGTVTISCTRASNGWAALCRETFTSPGRRALESTYLMSWDKDARQAHMFEVSGEGDVHDHAGTWSDDRSITVVHRARSADGQDEVDSITFTWPSAKRFDVKGEGTVGGKQTWTVSGTYRK